MEESHWRENSVFDRDERRFTVRLRRSLGGWQNPETQEWLRTCTIITGQPNELVAEIHTRMPAILPPETHEQWLTGEAGKEVLRPFPAKEMKISRISTRVNQPENNDAGLLEEGEMEQVGRLI